MAEVQLRSLRVDADFNPSNYVAGMNAKIAADKAGAASSAAVGAALTQTDAKVSSAADGLERFKRAHVAGYAALADFERGLATAKRGLDINKLTVDEAAVAIESLARKYGQVVSAANPVIASSERLAQAATIARTRISEQAAAVDELAVSYQRMAAEARAAQAADNAQGAFNRSFGIAQPVGNSASASASVFEEQLRQQEELERRMQEIARLRAQQQGQNFGSDLNARFGIGGEVNSARASASVFEEQFRQADALEQKVASLKALIDPAGASWAAMNRQVAEYNDLMRSGALSVEDFAKLETMARQRHEQLVASLGNTPGAANDNGTQFRRQNLGYQGFDIAQGLASGMPLGMIAAQQGPQIAQQYVGQGGIKALLGDVTAMAGGAAAAIGPIGLAFAAAAAAGTAFYFSIRKETKSTDDVLKEHAANIKALGDAYGIATDKARTYSEADKAIAEAATRTSSADLLEKQKEAVEALSMNFGQIGGMRGAPPVFQMKGGYLDFQQAFNDLRKNGDIEKFAETVQRIGDEKGIQQQADRILNAAKQSAALNAELEKTERLIREISSDKGPGGFLLSQGPTNTGDMGNLAAFQAQQAVAAARAEQAMRAQIAGMIARSPVEKMNAARDAAASQYNNDETPAARAQRIELAGTQALIGAQHELRQAQQDRQRQSQASLDQAQYEVSLIGKTVEERNRLMASYQAEAAIREQAARNNVAADEKEIASARAKAAAIADAQAKVSLGKLVEDQGYDAQRLQLEANLIGATTDQRARATAALEAEIRLKQQGIDTSSALAQSYIQEQVALAKANQEIQRQQAAFNSLQQAGGTVIDDLITGTGTMGDRLKAAASDMLKWVTEMALVNPLKNQLTGTNLPTLSDLFSGKPQVPNLTGTNTGTMTVNAATVMINGAVPGALPGAVPGFTPSGVPGATTTLSQFLGLGGASANTNGVRPTLTANGLVNSPVPLLAAANQNTMPNMTAIQDAIKSIESGGRYDIMGPITRSGDRAYGAYQIMGNNVPSWSEKWYGQKLTPQQLLANPGAQDAIFNGEISSNAARYGLDGAVSKWFSGSPYPSGKSDMLGTTDNSYVKQFNAALSRTSTNLTSAAKDVSTLGDSSMKAGTNLTDVFSQSGILGKAATPATPTGQLPSNFFPPAPTAGGFNPLSLFTSIFSLFGFADGTDFAPGGMAWVGERGKELVRMPRGAQVVPNHKLNQYANDNAGGGRMKVDVGVTVDQNGNLQAYVRNISRSEASTAAADHSAAAIAAYRQEGFAADMDHYRSYPAERG